MPLDYRTSKISLDLFETKYPAGKQVTPINEAGFIAGTAQSSSETLWFRSEETLQHPPATPTFRAGFMSLPAPTGENLGLQMRGVGDPSRQSVPRGTRLADAGGN